MPDPIRVGVDTGGTFTDFVYEQNGEIHLFKIPSTPSDPSLAIRNGLDQIGFEIPVEVVHGTTVGTNALLQRRGARTALITTKGFEDVLVIGRQARPELYNLNAVKPPSLVPDDLRFGVAERVVASGEVLQPLDEKQLKTLVEKLKRESVESVAVSFLFSFLHPQHEEQVEKAIEQLSVPVSISSRILPEYREYERTSTVVINAYLQPLMGRYLKRLNSGFGLRVMQSSGGSISAEMAAVEPVRTILSGPSGGVVGALRAAQSAGLENIVTFDMGGTSTDVALCDGGAIRTTNEATVAGLPVAVSVMDIHTVGAGGGSIARVDEGGSLRVGPESAGADPGPACYGRSMLPTVTDAHVVLGHFGGGGLLGGEFKLDENRAREAMQQLANDLSRVSGKRVSIVAAAEGILSVANTNMERALRHISVERGHDPRQFALLPFGGAGGLHAVELARALRIPMVIAPPAPGALSAVGVMVADVIKDQSRTVMFVNDPKQSARLGKVFAEMEREATTLLRAEGFSRAKQRHERSLAMRYRGQSFELEVRNTTGDIAASFHRAHRERYGYAQENSEIEIVSARLRSFGLVPKLPVRKIGVASGTAKPQGNVMTYFNGRKVNAALYKRDELRGGVKLKTPCIVTEYSATTLIPGDAKVRVDRFGNILIEL
ncbi:MAG TPA: hydantoinase/oxoprolinase family protein [Pyrinomonadaceae bacterium]|nr:hydantoinase/oxoprolinase family protein [Pyrinomonadaceae bacterium]